MAPPRSVTTNKTSNGQPTESEVRGSVLSHVASRQDSTRPYVVRKLWPPLASDFADIGLGGAATAGGQSYCALQPPNPLSWRGQARIMTKEGGFLPSMLPP